MTNFVIKKSKVFNEKAHIISSISLSIALSIIEALIITSIGNYLKSYFINIDLYLVAIPVSIIFIINWTSSKNILRKHQQDYQHITECFKKSLVVTVFLYMMTILINFQVTNRTYVIVLLLICFLVIYLSFIFQKDNGHSEGTSNINIKSNKVNKLFNTYYINISKVFEIAMLINNKVAISIENEKTNEKNESINESLNTNINIDYLNSIKNGISFQETYGKTNSTRNKVLESFEVKTTKSNLLDAIIEKSKEYNKDNEIKPGDLLLFNDVEIELENEKEAMETTRMLINGAFNGANISSTNNDMKMDLNMSSLINSMLKDYCYELKCSANGFVFYIKIPMSFENDFESNYNIYDILIGKMSLVGIYRGKDKMKKYKSAYEYFANKQNNNNSLQNSGLKRSVKSVISSIDGEVAMDDTDDKPKKDKNTEYVDIIAIIKEINIGVEEGDEDRNE